MIAERLLIALLVLTLVGTAAGEDAVPALPQGPFPNEYDISVTLDGTEKTISGIARVVFRNFSDQPVKQVPFHLYPNAFANTGTDYVRDSRRERLILGRGVEDAGYMNVHSVRDGAGNDRSAATRIDGTIMRVDLAEPLAPQGETRFVIDFTTRLPRIVSRMGKAGDHVNAMQWFPKVCAHVDGRFVDWQYRYPTEFFADFGSYRVSVTLPADYVIEATGSPVGEPRIEASSSDPDLRIKTVVFEASAVHDFAWCASPNFIRREIRTDSGTSVVLLSQPFMDAKHQLVLDVTRFALDRYGEWFFPYPYQRLVIECMPHGQGGGMEYPMLITIGQRGPEFLEWIRARSDEPAGVTVHELSHQYWYSMVATNEFEEAWLDEGITTYMTYKVMEEFLRDRGEVAGLPLLQATRVYRPLLEAPPLLTSVAGYDDSPFMRTERQPGGRLLGFDLPTFRHRGSFPSRFHAAREEYQPFADVSPLAATSFDIYRCGEQSAYRATSYAKPALMLRTLEGQIGWDRMKLLLRTWTRRYAFQQPTADDFVAVADEVTGGEYHDFLADCVHGSETIDFAVEDVRSFEIEPPHGYLVPERPGGEVRADFPPPAAAGNGVVAHVRALLDGDGGAAGDVPGKLYGAEVLVRNRGRLWLPTVVELRYGDGSTEQIRLTEERPWYRLTPAPRPVRLVAAVVDPRRSIALDLDVTNNGRLALPDRQAARSFAAFYQFWVQSWLAGVAWFT